MNIIFQKFLAVIESLIAILVPLHIASQGPVPSPTELVAAASPTPLPGFTSAPSPSASPTPIPSEVPEPTSAITPVSDPISELVEQLKQLKEEVAKMTPVPVPASTLVPPTPTPMPTPNPTISVLPVMSDTEYMVLTEPTRVGTITIQITDENGEVAEPNGAQVSLVNGDGRTEGPTREVLPMQPITGTTMTLNINAELYRKSRLAFGAGNPARRVYYKVLAVEGFDVVVR